MLAGMLVGFAENIFVNRSSYTGECYLYNFGDENNSASSSGGLIGYVDQGSVRNSYSKANVTSRANEGNSLAGGLIGRAVKTTIEYTYSTGDVTARKHYDTVYSTAAGGLIALVEECNLKDNYTASNVASYANFESAVVGGLIAYQEGIYTSYNNNYVFEGQTRKPDNVWDVYDDNYINLSMNEIYDYVSQFWDTNIWNIRNNTDPVLK